MTLKDTQVIFEFGEMFFSSKLLNGVYPNYKQVVFSDCDNKIRVNREELIATLRRINVSTTPTTNAMRLVFENNLLTVQVTAPDVDEATDTVTVKYDGPALTTIFNPEYVLEPLRNLTSDEVTIELNNSSSPGLIKDDTTFLYVIMPLRVSHRARKGSECISPDSPTRRPATSRARSPPPRSSAGATSSRAASTA